MTMPPELMELYMLYQQELETRSENENLIITNANTMMRVIIVQKSQADIPQAVLSQYSFPGEFFIAQIKKISKSQPRGLVVIFQGSEVHFKKL